MDDFGGKLILVLWVLSCSMIGYSLGDYFAGENKEEKEIIELSIELKKLEIKKLIKEGNNE